MAVGGAASDDASLSVTSAVPAGVGPGIESNMRTRFRNRVRKGHLQGEVPLSPGCAPGNAPVPETRTAESSRHSAARLPNVAFPAISMASTGFRSTGPPGSRSRPRERRWTAIRRSSGSPSCSSRDLRALLGRAPAGLRSSLRLTRRRECGLPRPPSGYATAAFSASTRFRGAARPWGSPRCRPPIEPDVNDGDAADSGCAHDRRSRRRSGHPSTARRGRRRSRARDRDSLDHRQASRVDEARTGPASRAASRSASARRGVSSIVSGPVPTATSSTTVSEARSITFTFPSPRAET